MYGSNGKIKGEWIKEIEKEKKKEQRFKVPFYADVWSLTRKI